MGRSMKKLLAIFLVLMLLSADICAIAEAVATLTLPSALKVIEEEAFAGNTSIEKVIVPDGTTEIRSRAFADSSMTELVLPDSLTFIAEDAFEGCGDFMLTVSENCYAYDRCVELGLIKSDEPDPSAIESAHPYPDEFDYTWTYDAGEGTESVTITFSADTETEEDYDFIYLYTLNDLQVGKYSGIELAGQSVTVVGTGFKLRLTSDEAWGGGNIYYGFKLDSIVPKKAVPLTFESITAESSVVNAGEIIRWTVTTTGGKAPVYCDYTVLLGEEEVATGTVEAPNIIEYTPVRVGEYKLSVIARDSADVVLPAQLSDLVTAAPSVAYPESAHPYAKNTDQSWVYAAEENVESLKVTFSEETKTESRYDYIWLYDQNGTQIGKYDGTTLTGQTIEIMGSAFTIRLTSDGSNQYHGFTITNIEKYIPGPLSFVSLTVDKSKAKTGELITWTMETEGGRRPVTYEYTVTLDDEIKYTGSVTRPEQITYVPMKPGDYTMSVVVKDAVGNTLPAQTSAVRISERDATATEHFTYKAINGLYASITGYTGNDIGIIVPETINDYTIQEISAGAFRDNATLVSVKLPDTITTIAASAFRNCDALRVVDLGQNVTSVGEYAFYDCDSLATFTFPDSVTTTGQQVLRSCDKLSAVKFSVNWKSADSYTIAENPKLSNIILPEGLKAVPSYAFRYCSNIKDIEFPSTLETIGSYAFGQCKGLTTIDLNEGLIDINRYAFEGCTGLTELEIPSSVIELSGFNDCTNITSVRLKEGLQKLDNAAFYGCKQLKELVLPDGVTIIGERALYGCTQLEELVLPDSVTSIGGQAFYNCEKLTEFHFPINWQSGAENIFGGCVGIRKIVIPQGTTMIPNYAFHNAIYIQEVIMPSTITSIGHYAFYNCDGIETIELSESINTIGNSAFYSCDNLLSPEFPNMLTEIGAEAFAGCISIEEMLLPDNVTTIGYKAFANCTSLKNFHHPLNLTTLETNTSGDCGELFVGCNSFDSVVIPEGISVIRSSFFKGATALREIRLPSTLESIGQSAFSGCVGLTELVLPDNLKSIGVSAFYNCKNLEGVAFGDKLESIAGGAFTGCSSLKEIDLPDSVTSIGNSAFSNCTSLEKFMYPLNLVYTGSYSHSGDTGFYTSQGIFEGCTSLEEISIPEGVTHIPQCIFLGAKYLKKIEIPSTLKSIGNGAFAYCEGLTEISFEEGLEKVGWKAFIHCTNLQKIALPDSVYSIGAYAFCGCSSLEHFDYPQNWSTIESFMNYYGVHGNVFNGCDSLQSMTIPEGVTGFPGYFSAPKSLQRVTLPSTLKAISSSAFSGCTYLQDVILPAGLKSIGAESFASCRSLTKLYISPNVTLIGTNAFKKCDSLVIHCEYGSTALQYAIDNEIPYFYLTLCDASRPVGSLYKGDSFELRGYVRSSDPIIDITGRIYTTDGKTVLQSINIVPDSTDYNIGEHYNYSLKFGNLDYGNYVYEITASTDEEMECLDRTSFTIVPPPQRTYFSNLNVPNGLLNVGGNFNLSGTVRSNYSISKFAVSVKNSSDSIRSQTIDVNAYSVDLSQFEDLLAFETLEPGSYTFSVYLSSNGNNKKVLETNFYVGEYDENLSEEQLAGLITFVQTTSNRKLFDAASGYSENAIQNMDSSDVALMVMDSSTNMFTGYVRGILQGKLTNMQVVDLYKKDIIDAIAASGDIQLIVDPDKKAKQKEKIVQWLLKEGKKDLKELKNSGLFSEKEMSFLTILFSGLKLGSEVYTVTMDLAESIYSIYATCEEGYLIIDTIAATIGGTGNHELQEAINQLHSEYRMMVSDDVVQWFNMAMSEYKLAMEEELGKFLVKYITSNISGVSVVMKAIDLGMKLTGKDDVAESYMTFLIRYNTYSSSIDAYRTAFDAVSNGDSSYEAMSTLYAVFSYAQQSTVRLCDALLGLDVTEETDIELITNYKEKVLLYSIK